MRRALLVVSLASWCVLLGAAAWRGLDAPVEGPGLDLDLLAERERTAERVRLDRVPASAHAVVVERPLFSSSRRPPAAPPAPEARAEAPTVAAPDFRVVGTFAVGGSGRVLVSAAGADPVMLGVGDRLDGWRVAAIEGRAVTFEREGARALADMDAAGDDMAMEGTAAYGPAHAAASGPAVAERPAGTGLETGSERAQGTPVHFTTIDDLD